MQLTFQARMMQFIAYSSRSLDRSFEMHPPEAARLGASQATSIGVVFGSGPN